MRIKRKLVFVTSGCILLLSSVVLLVNVLAQATKQAQIVFSSNRDGKPGTPNPEIYVMDTDGKDQNNLTNNPAWDSFPAWSPSGQEIAFSSDRDGNYEIYIMDADGKNPYRLTNNPAWEGFPAWSPDGQRITFAYADSETGYEIYVMNADGENPRNLTNNSAWDGKPDWFDPAFIRSVSSDGKLRKDTEGKRNRDRE